MNSKEEYLAQYLILFLKHLTIELSHLKIIDNHKRMPNKSILRKSFDTHSINLPLNQNSSTSFIDSSFNQYDHRQVSFTHTELFHFDPETPYHIFGRPYRQEIIPRMQRQLTKHSSCCDQPRKFRRKPMCHHNAINR